MIRLARANAFPQVGTFVPSIELRRGERAIVLRVEIPGVDRKDLDIRIENGVLYLVGEKKKSWEPANDGRILRSERSIGRFTRSYRVPSAVDVGRVEADYENGVLSVRMPYRKDRAPRRIPVRGGGVRRLWDRFRDAIARVISERNAT